jgi:hypothetical protein
VQVRAGNLRHTFSLREFALVRTPPELMGS